MNLYYDPAVIREKAVQLYAQGYYRDEQQLKEDLCLTDKEAAPYLQLFEEFKAKDESSHLPFDAADLATVKRILYLASEAWDNIPAPLQKAGDQLYRTALDVADERESEDLSAFLDQGFDPTTFRNLAESTFHGSGWGRQYLDGVYTKRQLEKAAMLAAFREVAKLDLD